MNIYQQQLRPVRFVEAQCLDFFQIKSWNFGRLLCFVQVWPEKEMRWRRRSKKFTERINILQININYCACRAVVLVLISRQPLLVEHFTLHLLSRQETATQVWSTDSSVDLSSSITSTLCMAVNENVSLLIQYVS